MAARAEAESSATEEIEVTPEMVEAGVEAFYEKNDPLFHDVESIVQEIYRRMVSARRQHL